MGRKTEVLAAAAFLAALSACANFWTIPGEPLTTAELCARVEAAPERSSPGGVAYRSTIDKDRLTAAALYELAAVGDPRFSFGYYHQANQISRRSDSNEAFLAAAEKRAAGPGYWTLRCREARERGERAL